MCTFRALFNKAIKEKQCPIDCYPFKEYQISKLKNEPTRKALTKEEISLIIGFEPDPETKQELSKHIFLFSFYTSGIPTAVISDSLGHESECVTKVYLESFENEVLDKVDEVLF